MVELSWGTIAVVAVAVVMFDFGMIRISRAILDLASAIRERDDR